MKKYINHSDLEDHLRSVGRQFKAGHQLKASIKEDIMTQIIHKPIYKTKPWYQQTLSWAPGLAAIILIATSATGVLADSAGPGDTLYPVDRFTESIAIQLAHDPIAKAKLYSSLADERVTELANIEAKRPTDSDAKAQAKWQKDQQEALAQVRTGVAQVSLVEVAVAEHYRGSTNPSQKEALLSLSKELQQESTSRDQKLDATANIKGPNPGDPIDTIPDVSSKDIWNYINTHTDAQREADAKAAADAFIKALNDHFKGSELNPGKSPKIPKESPMMGSDNQNKGGATSVDNSSGSSASTDTSASSSDSSSGSSSGGSSDGGFTYPPSMGDPTAPPHFGPGGEFIPNEGPGYVPRPTPRFPIPQPLSGTTL